MPESKYGTISDGDEFSRSTKAWLCDGLTWIFG